MTLHNRAIQLQHPVPEDLQPFDDQPGVLTTEDASQTFWKADSSAKG